MAKVLFYHDDSGWLIQCPGCGNSHKFDRGRWMFSGDPDKPTFHPSMLSRVGPMPEGHPRAGQVDVCHSWVRDGLITFLGDSTHRFAGQTLPLPDWNPVYQRMEDAEKTNDH